MSARYILCCSEFSAALVKKRCPKCGATFSTETKLMMHLGATHREVTKYLPPSAQVGCNAYNPPDYERRKKFVISQNDRAASSFVCF